MFSIAPSSIPVKPIRHNPRIVNRAPKGGATSPVNGRHYKGGWFMPMDPAPVIPPAPVPVVIAIRGFTYEVREIPAGECGTVAYAMRKRETDNRYDVIRNHFGEVTCDCPDYEMRRVGTGSMCKHGRALVQAGYIPAPAPGPAADADAEPEVPFTGRSLYAWARDHRAIGAVAAYGRAAGFPRLIINWSAGQATRAYRESAVAVEGGVL